MYYSLYIPRSKTEKKGVENDQNKSDEENDEVDGDTANSPKRIKLLEEKDKNKTER